MKDRDEIIFEKFLEEIEIDDGFLKDRIMSCIKHLIIIKEVGMLFLSIPETFTENK